MELKVNIEGNLTADPELRFTPAGKAVANFTVVTSKNYKDANDTWQEKDTSFWRCTVWDIQAENVAETLQKGDTVIVHGSMAQRSYETREGEKRTVVEVLASTVGPSLKRCSAKLNRTTRAASSDGTGRESFPGDDPWATKPPVDEPPF